MDVIYYLQGIEFEWNEMKARINMQKHGITFKEAAEVFFDPFYQTGDASVNMRHVNLYLAILSLNVFCWLCI